jgi:hypothetical protein
MFKCSLGSSFACKSASASCSNLFFLSFLLSKASASSSSSSSSITIFSTFTGAFFSTGIGFSTDFGFASTTGAFFSTGFSSGLVSVGLVSF